MRQGFPGKTPRTSPHTHRVTCTTRGPAAPPTPQTATAPPCHTAPLVRRHLPGFYPLFVELMHSDAVPVRLVLQDILSTRVGSMLQGQPHAGSSTS